MPNRIGSITIAAVGKIREKHWQAAQAEYTKRLRNYTNFRLVEVKDAVGRYPDSIALQREGATAEGSGRDQSYHYPFGRGQNNG